MPARISSVISIQPQLANIAQYFEKPFISPTSVYHSSIFNSQQWLVVFVVLQNISISKTLPGAHSVFPIANPSGRTYYLFGTIQTMFAIKIHRFNFIFPTTSYNCLKATPVSYKASGQVLSVVSLLLHEVLQQCLFLFSIITLQTSGTIISTNLQCSLDISMARHKNISDKKHTVTDLLSKPVGSRMRLHIHAYTHISLPSLPIPLFLLIFGYAPVPLSAYCYQTTVSIIKLYRHSVQYSTSV